MDEVAAMPAYARIAHYQLVEHPAIRRGALGDEVDARTLSHVLALLCMAYADEERYEEAIAAGERALRIAPQDDALRGPVLLNLGVAHSRSGDLVAGLACHRRSWAHARRAGDLGTLLKAGGNSLLALESGHPLGEPELAFLTECLPVFEELERRPEMARAALLLEKARRG
ncbi:hypothetical protein Acor_44780 [Acrocarpospora corrugata]|uniref:Uncharacterized protein n=1 Tax=Acrocarpospora corrugata TaxID=35763 RepID=A0A5M3W315_9ACTN|nr:hypothetical protein [Acrocarpospora corrugata]GES02412.1 hypothetical protein Acor_44780 [Acrocarpospora corrugata]